KAVQMNFWKTLLDAAHHLFIPLDLQIRMQPALHQHAGAADLHGLANLLVDRVKVQHIALGASRTFDRRVEGAESAVLGAEIRVINVAVDDVGDHTFRMQLAAYGIRLHADPDQIVRAEHLQGLGFGQGHWNLQFYSKTP